MTGSEENIDRALANVQSFCEDKRDQMGAESGLDFWIGYRSAMSIVAREVAYIRSQVA